MIALQRELSRLFRPAPARQPDIHRKARQQAKALAKQHGIEIEPLNGGMNVWPPKGWADVERWAGVDPFDGDHYCPDWTEALQMVGVYARAVASDIRTTAAAVIAVTAQAWAI
jgi:hypothetical protein